MWATSTAALKQHLWACRQGRSATVNQSESRGGAQWAASSAAPVRMHAQHLRACLQGRSRLQLVRSVTRRRPVGYLVGCTRADTCTPAPAVLPPGQVAAAANQSQSQGGAMWATS
jgi:hypothetical protein